MFFRKKKHLEDPGKMVAIDESEFFGGVGSEGAIWV
jgi:hypothetical protein